MSEEPKGGRRPPPAEHQFKKGKSGNPRGRPPKQERAISKLQLRRDILTVCNMPTKVMTAKGEKQVALIEAVLMRAAQKALAGHGPSIRFLFAGYQAATREHAHATASDQSWLEMLEEDARQSKDPSLMALRMLNEGRKRTRKV